MAQYARRTCNKCGIKDIQPNMVQVEIEYNSGSSTTGVAGRTWVAAAAGDKRAQKKTQQFMTHPNKRVYKRRRKVWMCPECAKSHTAPAEFANQVKGFFVLLLLIAAGFFLLAG